MGTALATALPHSAIDIRTLGILLGDDPALVWGPNEYRLERAAAAGQLATIENANQIVVPAHHGLAQYSMAREGRSHLTVARAAVTAWLSAHGTPTDQSSDAATWASAT